VVCQESGVGTGVYSLGAPRQLEFGLRITFYSQERRFRQRAATAAFVRPAALSYHHP